MHQRCRTDWPSTATSVVNWRNQAIALTKGWLRPLFPFFSGPRFTLQGQSLCRGLGAGSPATQGIALRYS